MHCNVINYNAFINYHRRSYAEQLPGMLLSQVVINIFQVGSIIWVQFFEWQLFGGTYQQSIILRGDSLSANCPRANYLGDNYRGSNFLWAIIRRAIILGDNCQEGNYPGEQLSGGSCPVPTFYLKMLQTSRNVFKGLIK